VWRLMTFVVLAVLAVGAIPVSAETPATNENFAAAGRQVLPLVGRWSRVISCQEMLAALRKAGLGVTAPAMIAGNGLVPGTPHQLAQKADICEGSTPRRHSHFFTRDGKFGSLDWKDQQVDDGYYRIIDRRTFRIIHAKFHYRIVNGNQLTLTPVITEAAKQRARAHPMSFSPAPWQVAVSLPGHTWHRVLCKGWC
jgi:hypothetical protein